MRMSVGIRKFRQWSRALGLATVASLFVVGSMGASAASFSNGSFETGVGSGQFVTLSAGSPNGLDIDGWTVNSGSVDYILSYWTAADGSRSVDLGGNEAGSIHQGFDTVAGQTYRVDYYISGNPDGAPTVKTGKVEAIGSFVGLLTSQTFSFDTSTPGHSRNSMVWNLFSFYFTAANDISALVFTSTTVGGNPNGAFGPALDLVSVTAVPLPAALWLMVGSLFGLFGAARRRKA
jgi:choice-of-anchor C domain-containing protein